MENTLNPVIVRFLRKFVGQWLFANNSPNNCFWRGGVRPCKTCGCITYGCKEPTVICKSCVESNDEVCRFCGHTQMYGYCPCDEDRFEQEYEEPDHSGPCRACGREINGSDWACYGFCRRWCATSYGRDDRW